MRAAAPLACLLAVAGAAVALAAQPEPEPQPEPPPAAEASPSPTVTPWATLSPTVTPQPANGPPPLTDEPLVWHRSRAVGPPWRGKLVDGMMLPAGGRDFFTWDPILKQSPNRDWRRWGTDRLVLTLLAVLAGYRAENPGAPRVGIGDLSRPRGGGFGKRYGGLGHASHQNGLDVDIYYPRLDRTERRPRSPSQIDRRLAQDLVDRFVAADAQYVFVGPRTGLKGPRKIVTKLRYHDDHLHVRIRRK